MRGFSFSSIGLFPFRAITKGVSIACSGLHWIHLKWNMPNSAKAVKMAEQPFRSEKQKVMV